MSRTRAPRPRCPRLHALPHRGPTGECTPLWCADESGKVKAPNPKAVSARRAQEVEKKRVKAAVTDLARVPEVPEEASSELRRLEHAERRRNARLAKLGALPDLDPKKVEAYAKEKFLALTPEAIQIMEAQLKFGDDKEQKEAARDVLEFAGFKRGEGRSGGLGPVVILFGNGVQQPPWASQPTVNTTAVKEIANGTDDDSNQGPHHQPGEREDTG